VSNESGCGGGTTIPSDTSPPRSDLVERNFCSACPNALWVADLTYCSTWSGIVYVAFVIDVFSRRILGWRVATTLRASLALDTLEMAIWSRVEPLDGLVHHSDRGVRTSPSSTPSASPPRAG
jgi:putative transposase